MKTIRFLIGMAIVAGLGHLASCVQTQEDCGCDFQLGTVIFTGAPEVDGCGWLIQIDSANYHPVNLDDAFRINGLGVRIKYDEVTDVYRCGRNGIIPSIRISDIGIVAENVGKLDNNEWNKYSMDPFSMDSAYISGDILLIRVRYSGGCQVHDFHLWKLPENALDPPPVELALSHKAHRDVCEAYITRWLAFSLVPIRQQGKKVVTFYLRGSPEMSAYFGTFTYRY